MARLALVVLAFGLIICVYAESEEHQKHRYQVNSQYSRSKGHYDNYRNKGRDNKSGEHGYNGHQEKDNPDYRHPGKGDYHHGSYEKSRGSGCDCEHNEDGYPNYKGSKGGYPNNRGSKGGYPNYSRSKGGYHNYHGSKGGNPNYRGSKGGYPNYRGSKGGYHNYHGSKGGNPNYRESKGGYPNYRGSKGGYPNYKGSNGGSYENGHVPGHRTIDGNYRNNWGKDYNRDDYESGQNHGYEKTKGSGYDSDYNNDGYLTEKEPKGGRYDPGYDRDSNSGSNRKNSGEDYNPGDYGSSKNNNFNYVQNQSHGSNYDDNKDDFNNYRPVYKGGNYDYNYNRFDSDINGSADERDSKKESRIDTPRHDVGHYENDERSRSVEHDNDTAKDSRNKQKIKNKSNVEITNNVRYSNQHTKVSTEDDGDTTESTNNKQKTESVRSKNDGLITNNQVNNHDNKVGITVRTDSEQK